jgi:hypothetical protein
MIFTLMYLVPIALAAAGGACVAESQSGISLADLVQQSSDLARLQERVATYADDGRYSIVDLYRSQLELEKRSGWILEEVFREETGLSDGSRITLPSNCLRTIRTGPALWILTGIHGEEPAGPNALVDSFEILDKLEKSGTPLVVMPLLNPLGYQRNWRYPNAAAYSETAPGASVGDSDHLLPDRRNRPRSPRPACPQAASLTAKVLSLVREYPPVLVLDLHEDNLLQKGYIYSQGKRGADDPVARLLVELLVRNEFPILTTGKTRFGETIIGGIVAGVTDGSIDELLSAPAIVLNGSPQKGPSAPSVLVLETSSMDMPLPARKKVHATVLGALKQLWTAAMP